MNLYFGPCTFWNFFDMLLNAVMLFLLPTATSQITLISQTDNLNTTCKEDPGHAMEDFYIFTWQELNMYCLAE